MSQFGVKGEADIERLVPLAAVGAKGIQIGRTRVEPRQFRFRIRDTLRFPSSRFNRVLVAAEVTKALLLRVAHRRRIFRVVVMILVT